MRNVPPDKYNVAWFKLAECVSRGEKERALGVYRLLAHSLQDSAFARQLQGDILLSFNDPIAAVEHYRLAAQTYKNEGRYLEAAALYEHILDLVTDKREPLTMLLELYSLLRTAPKVTAHATTLFTLLLRTNNIDEALRVMANVDGLLSAHETVHIRQSFIMVLAHTNAPLGMIVVQAEKVVDQLVRSADTQALQRFLSLLEALHPVCSQQVRASLHTLD